MNVTPDTKVEVTIRSGRKVLSRSVMEAHLIEAHMTVAAYMYGGSFGQANWSDPVSGRPMQRPRAHFRVVED